MKVFLIVPKGVTVLAAYTRETLCDRHARTELGVECQVIEVMDELPDSVVDSLGEFDDDDVTPVEIPIEPIDPEVTRRIKK